MKYLSQLLQDQIRLWQNWLDPKEQKSILTIISVIWLFIAASLWLDLLDLPSGLMLLCLTVVAMVLAGLLRASKVRADLTGQSNEAAEYIHQNRDSINDDVAEWLISTLDIRGEYDYQYLRDELATNTVWTFDQEVHRKGHSTTRSLLQGKIQWDRAGGPVTLQVPWLIIATVRERGDGTKYRELEIKPDFDRATVKAGNNGSCHELTEN